MNSVRICWRRRSSETSSRTSHRLPDGARRARTTSRGPSAPAGPNSPVAEPDPRPAIAVASTWVSRKTSMTVRPTRVRGSRPRSVPAARFAATMRRPPSTSRMPCVSDSTNASRSRSRTAEFGVEPVGTLAQRAHGRDWIIRWVRRQRGDGREGPATADAEDRGRAADEQRHERGPAIEDRIEVAHRERDEQACHRHHDRDEPPAAEESEVRRQLDGVVAVEQPRGDQADHDAREHAVVDLGLVAGLVDLAGEHDRRHGLEHRLASPGSRRRRPARWSRRPSWRSRWRRRRRTAAAGWRTGRRPRRSSPGRTAR